MLLGQALEEIRRSPDPMDLLAEDLDLVTLARANAAAEAAGASLSDVLRAAVDSFLGGASEEDWMQLVGRLQNGEGSPAVCVNLMLRRYLREVAADGCGC
jgi:hypothetical protein